MSAFTVLAEPSRRRILRTLIGEPKSVTAVVQTVEMSQPVVSKHLRVLREAGMVDVIPDGQRRLYSIKPDAFAEVEEWLMPFRRYWAGRLDALEAHLDNIRED